MKITIQRVGYYLQIYAKALGRIGAAGLVGGSVSAIALAIIFSANECYTNHPEISQEKKQSDKPYLLLKKIYHLNQFIEYTKKVFPRAFGYCAAFKAFHMLLRLPYIRPFSCAAWNLSKRTVYWILS